MIRPRAVLVITGSELARGDRADLNGPFLARQVLELGLEPARTTIVGDRPDELEAALREGLEADLCVVSGGLGPTHDDRTVEVLALAAGLPLLVDDELEREIGEISRSFAERMRRPYADFQPGVTKQATLPEGAVPLGLAGTAPGFVLATSRGAAVVLPGPPAELRRLWPRALESEPVRRVLALARPPELRVLRLYGVSESAVARALADAGGDGGGVEATICARDFEIHVDLLADSDAGARAGELEAALVERLEPYVFAHDERPVEALVLDLCRERGWSLATAESITGGLVGARLTSI
ncbi:MAG TPA: molybdopterin-binding protein, partial [Gaiellaceae bacterium]